MHLGHEREHDEDRGDEPDDEGPGPRIADDAPGDRDRQDGRHEIPDVAERERPGERDVVADEVPTGGRLLEQPPRVPRAQREHVEDLALIRAEVSEVSRRPAGRQERQPQHRDHRQTDERGPKEVAPAAGRPEPGGEREEERDRLRFGHERHRDQRGGNPVPTVDRGDHCRQRREDEDRLVLPPPRADVEHGRMEEDGRHRHHGPARSITQRVGRQPREPEVGDRGRGLHQHPDPRVARIDRRGERRLDRREQAPDVGHDRPERDRPGVRAAVQGRHALRRDVMDPPDELIEVAAEAGTGQQRQADGSADDDHGTDREPVDARPALAGRGGGGRAGRAGRAGRHRVRGRERLRRGSSASSARPGHRCCRRCRATSRTPERHRPWRARRRRAARAGSRTG